LKQVFRIARGVFVAVASIALILGGLFAIVLNPLLLGDLWKKRHEFREGWRKMRADWPKRSTAGDLSP
jgi:hypothetical protein